jgi:hypothetical protein
MKTTRENHFLIDAIFDDRLATLEIFPIRLKTNLFFCRLCKVRAAGCSRSPAARHGHELSPGEEEENVAPLNSTEWNKPPRQFSLIFSLGKREKARVVRFRVRHQFLAKTETEEAASYFSLFFLRFMKM